MMIHERAALAQRKRSLADSLDLSAILRGSLLQRTIRHRLGCPKCAAGRGHPVWVLAVGYPGGVIRQISLRKEVLPQVRHWLRNYQKVKNTLEKICELNQQGLRPQAAARNTRRSGD